MNVFISLTGKVQYVQYVRDWPFHERGECKGNVIFAKNPTLETTPNAFGLETVNIPELVSD